MDDWDLKHNSYIFYCWFFCDYLSVYLKKMVKVQKNPQCHHVCCASARSEFYVGFWRAATIASYPCCYTLFTESWEIAASWGNGEVSERLTAACCRSPGTLATRRHWWWHYVWIIGIWESGARWRHSFAQRRRLIGGADAEVSPLCLFEFPSEPPTMWCQSSNERFCLFTACMTRCRSQSFLKLISSLWLKVRSSWSCWLQSVLTVRTDEHWEIN